MTLCRPRVMCAVHVCAFFVTLEDDFSHLLLIFFAVFRQNDGVFRRLLGN